LRLKGFLEPQPVLKKKKRRFSIGTCTILKTTTMGVDGLLRELHGGRMTEQSVGFAELTERLHKSKRPIDIDTAICPTFLRHWNIQFFFTNTFFPFSAAKESFGC
jgi:hypothetical protein